MPDEDGLNRMVENGLDSDANGADWTSLRHGVREHGRFTQVNTGQYLIGVVPEHDEPLLEPKSTACVEDRAQEGAASVGKQRLGP